MGKEAELIKAAKTGDIRTLERHFSHLNKRSSMIGSIKKHLHPNIQDEVGYTLLHHATLNGQRETVSFLLQNGASTTIPDTSGSYPLHLASWKGDIEIVKMLVTQGPSRANVDQQSNTEDTALHLAAQYGYCGVVEFLLERHANPMMKNIRGETPLDLAAQFGHVDTVHVLISHHPEILRLSRPEICPLHLAARNGHSVVVLSLINAGIPINSVCKSGSALHEAALCGKENTVKLLLDKGIDINLRDSEGRTALSLLADFNAEKYTQIKTLIQRVAEKNNPMAGRYNKLRKHRLLAVPRKDSKPISQHYEIARDLCPLQYREGDTIEVESRQSTKVYLGTNVISKDYGYFQSRDVRFYQDIDGKLHRIDPKDIFESPDSGSLHVLQKSLSLMNPQQEDTELPTRKSMLIPRAKNKEEEGPQRSLSTSESLADTQAKEKKKKSRFTDKEKKFILSKDKGDYSQLAPVTAPSSKDAEIKEVTKDGGGPAEGKSGGFIGSYYLLEVSNFDIPDIPPPFGTTDNTSPRKVSSEEPERGVVRHSAPQYENIKLKLPPPPQVTEKPRSTSLRVDSAPSELLDSNFQRRPHSFRSYENVKLDTPDEQIPQVPPLSIDHRAPMPLPSKQIPLPPSTERDKRKSSPRKREDYSEVSTTGASGEFKIREDYEDVMVSSFNPNYSKIAFKRKTESNSRSSDQSVATATEQDMHNESRGDTTQNPPVDSTTEDITKDSSSHDCSSPETSIMIISQDTDPFAGLVQSSSVVSGLCDIGGGIDDDVTSPRHRLKSVWDDTRVNREWNQIDDYLNDVKTSITQYKTSLTDDTTLTMEAMPILATEDHFLEEKKSSVSLWLSGMGLRGYTSTFERNGFDDIRFMGGGLLDVEDLKEIGIYDNDQGTIMIKAAVLPPPPRLRGIKTVEEWLSELCLSHLSGHFEGYTLEKIASLWEIQLSTILGIELLGYKKRLLYGINELKKDHSNTISTKLPTNEMLVGNNSPMSDVDFTKDYSQIRSKKKEDPISTRISQVENTMDDSSVICWKESKIHTSKPTTPTSELIDEDKTVEDHTPPVRGSEYATIPSNRELYSPSNNERKNTYIPPTDVKNYHTWYLGSALVKGTTGKYSAEEACLKLRTQTDGIGKMPRIILSISWKGVKFIDADSKMVVSTHLIRDISHCCPDIEDPRVFAYMTKEKETNRNYCHVFMVQSKEVADEIILTVGQAFEVAYQAVVRARSNYKSPSSSPKRTSKSSLLKKPTSTSKLKKSTSGDITENGIR